MEELKKMMREMEEIQKNIVLKKLQKSIEMLQNGNMTQRILKKN